MPVPNLSTLARFSGGYFLAGVVLLFCGLTLWSGRNLFEWPLAIRSDSASGYLMTERASIAGSILLFLLGYILLAGLLRSTGEFLWAQQGATLLVVASAIGLFVEATFSIDSAVPFPITALYVLLSFAAQAIIGLAILRSGLLSQWIGWLVLAMNVAMPAVVFITQASDRYFPYLFIFSPLLLGIVLLRKQWGSA